MAPEKCVGMWLAIGMAAAGLIWAETPSPRSVWDGAYTAEQAKRGEAAADEQCTYCHGAAFAGGEGPPQVGDEFLSAWNGQTVGELFERIRRTMPKDEPNHLTRQQVADIVAYLFSLNGFPAGQTELPVDADALRGIKIEARK